jgi:hypothetical protein
MDTWFWVALLILLVIIRVLEDDDFRNDCGGE